MAEEQQDLINQEDNTITKEMMEVPLLHLGRHYVSDFLDPDERSSTRQKFSLDLYLDPKSGAVRLGEVAPPSTMWGKYWYRSGTNATMTKELGKIVEEVVERVKYKPGDIWLDIACNDGTLLKQVPSDFVKVGIDPCDDSYYEESSKHATIVQDYFSKTAWDKSGYAGEKAKIITCIAMFYDLEDPHPFIQDMYDVLDDDGIIVLQLSYTPLMMQQMAFDNICHEHVYYHSLSSIAQLFHEHKMMVVDAQLNDVNGGSLRVYIAKHGSNPNIFGTEQLRHVCQFRTDSLLVMETGADITRHEHWQMFAARLEKLKADTLAFIDNANKEGKTVYGYGASTKGNTLLQYFGLTGKDIVAIAERSQYKWGKKTVGSEIPIISEEECRAAKPDYMLVLPWHFIDEFVKREREYLENGGAFIVPCPEFKVITKDDL